MVAAGLTAAPRRRHFQAPPAPLRAETCAKPELRNFRSYPTGKPLRELGLDYVNAVLHNRLLFLKFRAGRRGELTHVFDITRVKEG
jgi:hypothetical protein